MPAFNDFGDILSAMEQDPALRDAMRNHVLGEEFLQLPAIARRQEELITLAIERQMELAATLRDVAEQISGYALVSSRVITTTVERQDRIDADIVELKAAQARLEASVQGLLESQARMESDIAELKAGQGRMEVRQGRMETDISELKAGQARMEVRQDRMEARQDRMETDISELKVGQARMEARQDRMEARQDRMETDISELKAGQARMEGQLGNLTGTDYERKVAKRVSRAARRYMGLQQSRVVYGITVPDDNRIADLLRQATETGAITDEQADELERVDLILAGAFSDDEPAYAVAEVSLTIDEHDVDRANIRAGILQDASGAVARPVVIGTVISNANRQRAEQDNVTIIIMAE